MKTLHLVQLQFSIAEGTINPKWVSNEASDQTNRTLQQMLWRKMNAFPFVEEWESCEYNNLIIVVGVTPDLGLIETYEQALLTVTLSEPDFAEVEIEIQAIHQKKKGMEDSIIAYRDRLMKTNKEESSWHCCSENQTAPDLIY